MRAEPEGVRADAARRAACLVSVIIPAFNAERTLDATLQSVRAQTYRDLEILIINDGSSDRTLDIAHDHAGQDPRIHILSTENGGVAHARNVGIRAARGGFIAPIDADDLWAPTKIERQVRAMQGGGDGIGLCYTWSAHLDPDGRVTATLRGPLAAGDVLARLCETNLVGNGSSALIRAEALDCVGLYDPGLRAQDAEGCEDLDLYLRIAERYRFAVIPEHLTGYRTTPGNMSSNLFRMHRSRRLVMSRLLERRRDLAAHILRGERNSLGWMMSRALDGGRVGDAFGLFAALLRDGPVEAAPILLKIVWRTGRNALGAAIRPPGLRAPFFSPSLTLVGS
ncbi:MAG: glycosyltransferase [Alphaproteobacteria bacterium]|nr:glycosyltransferase [Alphaproteobacteria bacterium]